MTKGGAAKPKTGDAIAPPAPVYNRYCLRKESTSGVNKRCK